MDCGFGSRYLKDHTPDPEVQKMFIVDLQISSCRQKFDRRQNATFKIQRGAAKLSQEIDLNRDQTIGR